MIKKTNRNLEFIVTAITVLLFIIISVTYIIDKSKSNFLTGPLVILVEIILSAIQCILLFSIWSSKSKDSKVTLLIASLIILSIMIYQFIDYNLKTT